MPRMLATLAASVSVSGWISNSACACCSSYTSLLPNVQQVWELQFGYQEFSSRALSSATGTDFTLAVGELEKEQRRDERGLCPTVDSLNQVISSYQADGRLDDGLKVWNSFNQMGVLPNMATYGILIGIFQQQNDPVNAVWFYRKAREQFLDAEEEARSLERLQEVVRDFCLDAIHKGMEQDENRYVLQNLFQKMQSVQLPLCKFVCRTLLLKCGERKDDHVIMGSFYRYMREKRILTTALCNYCITVLGKHGKFWAALEVYEQMVKLGPRPDQQSRSLIRFQFGQLLNEAKQKNMWKLSLQLIGKMLDRGFLPGKRDWEAALITCSKAGRTEETVVLFQRMVSRKCKPEEHAFGALLSAFEKQGRIQDMERVVTTMQRSGVPLSEWIYTTLITGYGKVGDLGAVARVVQDMETAGVQLSVVTFNAILTACARKGAAEGALEWFRRMEAAGLQGNSTTFNKLVEALANGGRWKEAVYTYVQMRKLKLQPSPWAYDAVVLACNSSNVQVQQSLIGYRPRQLKPNVKLT